MTEMVPKDTVSVDAVSVAAGALATGAPQPMQMAEENAGEGPPRVVSITGRTGHWLTNLVFTMSDGTERRFVGPWGDEFVTGYTVPEKMSPDEWIVMVQQLFTKDCFLGAGFIFTLNTGRKISLMGVRAKDRKNLRNRRVVDSATEHVVGLKFDERGLDTIEVESRVSGGVAKVPEKLPDTKVGTDVGVDDNSIKWAIVHTEISKNRWERMRPKSWSEHAMCCRNFCLDICFGSGSNDGEGTVGNSGYNPTSTTTSDHGRYE